MMIAGTGHTRAKAKRIKAVNKGLDNMFRNAGHIEPIPTVTKAERDVLAKYRARPQPQLRPTPSGTIQADLETNGEKIRERRIKHIDTRLTVADHKMRLDRLRSVHEGRAKSAFNVKTQGQDKGQDKGRER